MSRGQDTRRLCIEGSHTTEDLENHGLSKEELAEIHTGALVETTVPTSFQDYGEWLRLIRLLETDNMPRVCPQLRGG